MTEREAREAFLLDLCKKLLAALEDSEWRKSHHKLVRIAKYHLEELEKIIPKE